MTTTATLPLLNNAVMEHTGSFLIIGNPENRRVALFQEALKRAGRAPAAVISYLSLLNHTLAPEEFLKTGTTIRIESPGENFEVEKRILALGGVEHALQLENERGRIYYPQKWFLGFSRLMSDLARPAGPVSWFNHPSDVVSMFDKPLCKKLLQPHTLASYPAFDCYDAFFSFAERQPVKRFFIKLNTASSASGVLAYEYNCRTGQENAYSTVEVVHGGGEDRFYNSLKIKKYTARATIRKILDFLFGEGALIERWIPKARHAEWSFDLRVVAIAGRRCHALARLSRSPMTNLHLGNQRCGTEALNLPSATWEKIDILVQQTMQHFPRSLYAGLDVLIPRDGQDPVLLEANAFGDLLPNLLHNGKDTYLTQIEAMQEQQKCA